MSKAIEAEPTFEAGTDEHSRLVAVALAAEALVQATSGFDKLVDEARDELIAALRAAGFLQQERNT